MKNHFCTTFRSHTAYIGGDVAVALRNVGVGRMLSSDDLFESREVR